MPFGIAEFIESSNAAETPEALFALYERAIGEHGYDRFMYAMISDDPIQSWHQVPSVIKNYPDDWMSFYIENGFMAIDPLREIAFKARRPILWDDVPGLMNLSEEQERCLYGGIESGLYNGIGVPFHGPFGEVAGIGLASSEKRVEVSPTVVSMLGLLSTQLHTACITLLFKSVAEPRIVLTPREKEVLLWCSRGKSNWVIGEILRISENSVKFHVKNCVRKLSAESRIAAVLKAIRLGLISP